MAFSCELPFQNAQSFRKGLQAAFQYAMHLGYGYAIIGDRDMASGGMAESVLHFPLGKHTYAAVDDKRAVREVFREFRAGCKGKAEFFLGIFPNPCGQFYRADVAALPMVGAAFADKRYIAVPEPVKLRGPFHNGS